MCLYAVQGCQPECGNAAERICRQPGRVAASGSEELRPATEIRPQKVTTMIDKIKNLKWYFQLLMLVVVGGLIYSGVWYFVTSSTRAETEDLNNQIAQLTAKNHAAEIAVEHINEFRAMYASKQQEYDELKVLLPEQREITNVLQGLQDTARDARLTVMRFSPRDDQ